MVQDPRPISPPWADPESLLGFVDELRRAGYNVGLDQYAAAQDLLLALVARGEPLEAAESFSDLLGPLLCTSVKEQSEFKERFARWAARAALPAPLLPEPDPVVVRSELAKEVAGLSVLRLLWAVGIGIVLGPIVSFLILFALWFQSEGASPELGWSLGSFLGLLTLLAVIILAARLWWRRRAEMFLARRQVADDGISVQPLAVRDFSHQLFQSVSFFRIAQDLRRRREVPSTELDVPATVATTVAVGGWLAPVYAVRQVTPEYLVLIDRVGFTDQQARLADELVNRLAEHGLFFTRYYFQGDPRICFPHEEDGAPVRLRDLSARHPFHRLILITDAAGLFSPRTGTLAPWIGQLTAWEHRSLLTPEVPEQWGSQEADLARLFSVFPATIEGLASLARRTQAGTPLPRPAHKPIAPYPRELRDRTLRWVDRNPPTPTEIEALLSPLRRFLGEPGFFWLAACAVYPALDWGLTLYLGEGLQMDGAPLLDPGRLRSLVRTPWLRHGFMPDWLREKLLAALSPDQEKSVRTALEELLVTSLEQPADVFQLEVARPDRKTLRSLGRQILRLRSRKAPEESPLRDRVFLSFMTGGREDPLAVRLPRALRGLFSRWRALGSRPAAAAWKKPIAEEDPDRPGNPWENRRQVGMIPGFLKTLVLFLIVPLRAFRLTHRHGDLASPLYFAALVSLLAFAIGSLVSSASAAALILSWNFFAALWLGVLHISLLITRSLKRSTAGLRGSVRLVGYSTASQLVGSPLLLGCIVLAVPLWLVWLGLLTLIGVREIHGTSWRRAAFVVFVALTPLWLALVYFFISALSGPP